MGKRVNTAVWFENQKRWQIKVQKDGIRRTFTSSTPGRKGLREANAKADLWLDDGVDGSSKVSVMKERYLQYLKDRHVSKEHIIQNEKHLRLYLMPVIGRKRIGDVTEENLQTVLNYAHSIGNNGKGLAYKTLKTTRGVIQAFVKYCRIAKTTKLFPENLLIPNDAHQSTRKALQPDDIKKVFRSDQTTYRGKIQHDWYIHAYRIEIIVGFRPGELIGLDVSDIIGNRCTLKRAVNRFGETTHGKNKNAIRSFEIPEIGMREIRAQRKMLLSAGIQTNVLFPTPDGERLNQQLYRQSWNRYKEHNGIADRTPYELRHTFFSANKDMPEELIKPIGGHSKSFDGFSTYSHELDGDAHRAAQWIDNTFSRILGSDQQPTL